MTLEPDPHVSMTRPHAAERFRQTYWLFCQECCASVAERFRGYAAARFVPAGVGRRSVRQEHLVRAAERVASGWTPPLSTPVEAREPLTVAWVCAPPRPGSGRHKKILQMVCALESAGHTCIVMSMTGTGEVARRLPRGHPRLVDMGWQSRCATRRRDRRCARDRPDSVENGVHGSCLTGQRETVLSPAGLRAGLLRRRKPITARKGCASPRFPWRDSRVVAITPFAAQLRNGRKPIHFDFPCDLDHFGVERSQDPMRTGIYLFRVASAYPPGLAARRGSVRPSRGRRPGRGHPPIRHYRRPTAPP